MTHSQRCQQVLSHIDTINAQDPNLVEIDGKSLPKEQLYSEQMYKTLNANWPNASEYLQIAVYAQHIKRWSLKRTDYPEGRAGYLTWRKDQGKMHAHLTAEIMAEHGYSKEEQERVAQVLRKEKLKSNDESQALEDVACLVFLAYYLVPFAQKHSEEKLISIIQKTWRKMSDKGHSLALKLPLPGEMLVLINKALA